jgi:hypothetical protein
MAVTADVPGAARDESAEVAGTAQAEAEAVGGSAAAAAQDVVETAAEQAGHVAGEGIRNVRELLGDLRDELGLQTSTQTMRAGELAYTLADDLESMAEGSQQQGAAAEVARSVASQARRVGEFLQSRDPDQLLEEVRLFARRRPGAFLLGAAAAGVAAGRLGRGAAEARSRTSSAERSTPRPAPRPAPVPAAPATVTPGVVVVESSEDVPEGERLGQEVPAAPVAAAGRAAAAPPAASRSTPAAADAPTRDLTAPARRAAADARRSADARRVRR